MKVIRGQKLRESDWADMEAQLRELFYAVVFKPIVDIMAPHSRMVKDAAASMKREVRNAAYDPIVSAIRSGRIQYVADEFSGEFSAAISRALHSYGAKFNRLTKTYAVLPQQLPVEVLDAAAEYAAAAKGVHDSIEARLAEMLRGLKRAVQGYQLKAGKTIKKMDFNYNRQFGDALGTEDLSDQAREALDRKYINNLKPYIEQFSEEMIHELRHIVVDNARTGYRFETLVKRVESRFGVSQSKAEFLARNETSRFVSEHRQQRFRDAGIRQYVWQCADDSNVRPDHKKLDGKTFDYAHPPVVDEATGRRANPGFDYNCRCIDNPVLPRDVAESKVVLPKSKSGAAAAEYAHV